MAATAGAFAVIVVAIIIIVLGALAAWIVKVAGWRFALQQCHDRGDDEASPSSDYSALKVNPDSVDPSPTVTFISCFPNTSCHATSVYLPGGKSGIENFPSASVTA